MPSRPMQRNLKEGTDGKKFADDAFLFFKDMPDSL